MGGAHPLKAEITGRIPHALHLDENACLKACLFLDCLGSPTDTCCISGEILFQRLQLRRVLSWRAQNASELQSDNSEIRLRGKEHLAVLADANIMPLHELEQEIKTEPACNITKVFFERVRSPPRPR